MINYWWVTRPKRKLNTIPEILATVSEATLNAVWSGERRRHLMLEESLEKEGLKREGSRRDQTGGGARTYLALLKSLGLMFEEKKTQRIYPTMAGEAILNGANPIDILTYQVLKYQFPSSFSISKSVQVSARFHIHPFIFLLRLLRDDRIGDLSQEEIAKVVIVQAEGCNLDCKYCYIHTKRNKDMSLEMAKSILEPFLMKKAGPVDITFMGGETLLAIDVIRPIVEWAKQNKWNRKYRFLGSTNGTLLNEELKQWLADNKRYIILGLSYDGLPSSQVDNRGNDNVDVDFFIRTWPKQPIQMTINVDSVPQMAEGVIYLLEKGAVVHPNVAFEAYDWPDEKIREYAHQLNVLIEYYNSHKDLPVISQFSHNLIEYANCIDNPQHQCEICGVGNGLQVFDVDGQVYPCHMLSPLVLEGEKLQKVKDGIISQTTNFADPRCSTCPYNLSCATCMGCNYIYRGSVNRRDNTHCKIMKVEVKAFIKKEVQRLSAKASLTPVEASEVDAIKKLLDYENRMKNRT